MESASDKSEVVKSRAGSGGKGYSGAKKIGKGAAIEKIRDMFERLTGFACEDLCSFEGFARAMYRPVDPASLGVARALFGLCMVVDVVEERGLANIDLKWGDPHVCHFPLIHGMRPPSLPWMTVLYALMWLGAFGMTLGLHFKKSCALFALPYWYIHLLDKSHWNNHSYLFGLVALLFWGTSANRYLALDARLYASEEEKRSVPYWNYFILKFQFFVLYFLAGLKKSSREWLEGYAMVDLSRHWVFEPFKLLLSTRQTDFFIVHWFGFVFDLTVGFFMLFDETRLPAMFFCTMFHLMNSQLFSIGMFPFVCLATMPLFCHPDWPRKYLRGIPWSRQKANQHSEKSMIKTGETTRTTSPRDSRIERPSRVSGGQKLVAAALLFHMGAQFFLPYSHFLTKGYNNWVPGPYGYSWDMMVHAWDTVLVVVRVRDNQSGRDHFLDGDAWVLNDRWAKHGDMVRQYAHCVKDNLEKLKGCSSSGAAPWRNVSSDISIYVDVWCSLNGRFQQRLFDPNVDLLKADWHPLKPVSYLMPLLEQFSPYRPELERIQQEVLSWSNHTDVLFVADYPGLVFENYVGANLDNVTLHVLEGEVLYRSEEEEEAKNHHRPARMNGEEGYDAGRTMAKGGYLRVETGRFHSVETTSAHPACYMYTFAHHQREHLPARGTKEAAEALPIVGEIGRKVGPFGRAVGHVAHAVVHLVLDVPMAP
ncbi:vitamin K-dependent gamma-carboxylase [Copidosoma floridanum]|uniref:vitamin K-dependent gamma-carboxylase n=1 Tax=Copidosoma floridanum TaxID=29053 RepID=UPI0006C99D1A|nr:vitamin K-dependent gamma-carboxylase [Copidosoma floridanum]